MPELLDQADLEAAAPAWDELELTRSVCRGSFREFVREFWDQVPGAGKRLVWSWHIEVFCAELQKVFERVAKGLPREYDLVINVSPGTTKSTVHSILFPAWIWTRMPEARILTASHTESLVLNLSAKSRDVIKSAKYRRLFPNVVIRQDKDAKGHYATTEGGERLVCTVAGKTPLGEHSHIIIVDDPIDPQKMLSDLERQTAASFMTEWISNRKVDKALTPTILVMQRLGVGDPTEVMLEQAKKPGAAKVRHVCLPSELEKDPATGKWEVGNVQPPELAAKYVDGLMDPVRLSRPVLDENKAKGALFYATQFLQRPFTAGGGMFKEIYFNLRVKAAPYVAKRVRSWDRAATEGGGANTAGTLIARDAVGNFYVEDCVVCQLNPDERDEVMIATAHRDRLKYGPSHEPDIFIEHEPGSSGVDAYKATARKLAGFRVYPNRPTGNKETRAEPWACLVAGTLVETNHGPRKIEGVREGELVLTRKGFRKVLWSGKTKEVTSTFQIQFGDGAVVEGTEDHRIWIFGKGWIRFDQICPGDEVMKCCAFRSGILCSRWKNSWSDTSRSCSTALRFGARRGSRTSALSGATTGTVACDFTKQFGFTITAKSRKGGKSTIGTEIPATMQSIIWNAFQGKIMEGFMGAGTWKRCLGGTRPRKLLNTVEGTGIELGPRPLPKNMFVDGVGACSLPGFRLAALLSIVPSHAVQGEARERLFDIARFAGKRFGGRGQEPLNTVPGLAGFMSKYPIAPFAEPPTFGTTTVKSIVQKAALCGRVPVYDLTVDGEHEFFANGVLVHNSQLAAKNVYVVDNGKSQGAGDPTWDIEAFIKEHVAFPNAPMKDRVDSASDAFLKLLATVRATSSGLRVLQGRGKFAGPRIVFGTARQFGNVGFEQRVIMVRFLDPDIEGEQIQEIGEGVMCSGSHDAFGRGRSGTETSVYGAGSAVGSDADIPFAAARPSFINLLDSLDLKFADLNPANLQEDWHRPLYPWGKLPAELIMKQDDGKRLWSFIQKKRDPAPEVFAFIEEDGDRALSAAQAVCDIMRLDRSKAMWSLHEPDNNRWGEVKNPHVFNQVKSTRGLVM